jgi:hypothetical protein
MRLFAAQHTMSVPPARHDDREGLTLPSNESDLAEALTSVRRIVGADPRDWTVNRHDAFIYGLFQGWDDPEAERSVAAKHGWNEEFLARLHRLQAAVSAALS